MLASRAGSARTHYFEESKTMVYNLKLYANELKKASSQNGFINFGVVQDDENLSIYPVSDIQMNEDLKKKGTPILSFSIAEDNVSKLIDTNGYIDLVAAPNLKDETQKKHPSLNAFVIYQKQANPSQPDKKINFICGNAYNYKEMFIGNAFVNKKENAEYLNILINKTRLLSVTPPNQNVYISLSKSPKSNSYLVNLSPDSPSSSKDYIFKLDMNIINTCAVDSHGNLNLTAAQKQEKSILQDGADMNIWDNSPFILHREKSTDKEFVNTQNKLFVGKGFSEKAQSVFLDRNNENVVPQSELGKGSFVNFQLENDYYLNKTFGVGSYQVCGKVTEISQDNLVINSPAGNFSIPVEKATPATNKDFDTFNIFYDNLKEIIKTRQKEAVLNVSPEKKNNSLTSKPSNSKKNDGKTPVTKKSTEVKKEKGPKKNGGKNNDVNLSM